MFKFVLQSLGSRIAKRLRLRREECSSTRAEDGDSKKHFRGHHRRHSSGKRQSANINDIISQCIHTFTKEPVATTATTTSDNTTYTSPQNDADTTQPIDAYFHCRNAEKYAKASIDLFSSFAQNFTAMMDPFPASNEFERPAGPSSATNTPKMYTTKSSGTSTADINTPVLVNEGDNNSQSIEKTPAEKSQSAASTSITNLLQQSSDINKQLTKRAKTMPKHEIDDSFLVLRGESSSDESIDSFCYVRPMHIVEHDYSNENMANTKEQSTTGSNVPPESPIAGHSATSSAYPQSKIATGIRRTTPDYRELSRTLRTHIEDIQKSMEPHASTLPPTPDAEASIQPKQEPISPSEFCFPI